MGSQIPLSVANQIESILTTEVKILDLIEERFIADLQNFGCPLSIPVRFSEDFADQLTFGFEDGFLLDLFQTGKFLFWRLLALEIFGRGRGRVGGKFMTIDPSCFPGQ